MKKAVSLIVVILCYSLTYGLHVTIVESKLTSKEHAMDGYWKDIVKKLGHTADITEKSILDNTLFFAGTDILIVSSGVMELSNDQTNTILKFIKSGKPVYLQTEYLRTLSTNQAFKTIVESLGGNFDWKTNFQGDLFSMQITEPFNTGTNTVGYYWYSVSGQGDCNMTHFLKFGNEFHGFQYIPENPAYGTIVTTTDQDWITQFKNSELMENIIKNLITPKRTIRKKFKLRNDTAICEGKTLLLDPLISNATFLWQDLSTMDKFLVREAGTYWVRVITGNCVMRDTVNVAYISKPRPNLGKDTVLCNEKVMVLNAGPTTFAYLWQDNTTQSTLKAGKAGTYWVQASNICGVARDSMILKYDSLNTFELGNDTIMCEGNPLTLKHAISGAAYLWQDNSTDPAYTINKPGKYWVNLTKGHCTISDTINVTYIKTPGNNFDNFTTLCQGKTLILKAHANYARYLWQDNSTDSVFYVRESGRYWVIVTNICGTYADTMDVDTMVCNCYIYMPNAFTPNSDELNDGFLPLVTTCDVVDYHFAVYNGWGERLFDTNTAGAAWDGTYKGSLVQSGVYMYILQMRLEDNTTKNFSGSFTLMD